MKILTMVFTVLAWIAPAQREVWAADAAGSYGGDALTGIFIGFCVLLVTVQLVPTMVLLAGAVKGFRAKAPVVELDRQICVRER